MGFKDDIDKYINNLDNCDNVRSTTVIGVKLRNYIEQGCNQNPDMILELISVFKCSHKKENILTALGFIADNDKIFLNLNIQKFWEDMQIEESKISIFTLRDKFFEIPKMISSEKSKTGNDMTYSEVIKEYPDEFLEKLKDVVKDLRNIHFKDQPSQSQKIICLNNEQSKDLSKKEKNSSEIPHNMQNIKYNAQTINIHKTVIKNDQKHEFEEHLQNMSIDKYKLILSHIDLVDKRVGKLERSDASQINQINDLMQRVLQLENVNSSSSPTSHPEGMDSLSKVEEPNNSLEKEPLLEGINTLPNNSLNTKSYLPIMSDRENECTSDSVSFICPIKDFNSLRCDPIRMRESDHFYTSECGYKMCLRIYANGNGKEGTNTHLSVFYAVMKGDYDDKLRWPFSGIVTLTLLDKTDKTDKNDFYKTFSKCKFPECYTRPSKDYNDAYGDRRFYPLKKLSSKSRYLINGTISVKISIEIK